MIYEGKTTAIPLHTLDYTMSILNPNQFKILMFIWRWTEGVGSGSVSVAMDDMSAMTKIARSALAKAIARLVELDLIFVDQPIRSKPASYSLNTEAGVSVEFNPAAAKINGEWVKEWKSS